MHCGESAGFHVLSERLWPSGGSACVKTIGRSENPVETAMEFARSFREALLKSLLCNLDGLTRLEIADKSFECWFAICTAFSS
jgi:hypothetical protein